MNDGDTNENIYHHHKVEPGLDPEKQRSHITLLRRHGIGILDRCLLSCLSVQPDENRENLLEMGGEWGENWNNHDGPGSPIEEHRAFVLEHEPVPVPCGTVTITTIPNVIGTAP